VALLDGTLLPASAPLLRADDLGVTRGDGVFETTLVVDGVPRDRAEHLARMAVSARLTALDLPEPAEWDRAIDALVGAWTGGEKVPREMVLRLIATRGPEGGRPTCFAMAGSVPTAVARQRVDGVRVLLLDRGFSGPAAAAAPWLLAGAKTLSYAVNMAALRFAAAHEAEDVIFVGSDGVVLEAPTATVVIARGRTLLSPPLPGVLPGITAARLFEAARIAGWEVSRDPLRPADLHSADGVWLASSVRLLARVQAIDGAVRGDAGLTGELLTLLAAH